jgi:hypothetical protein
MEKTIEKTEKHTEKIPEITSDIQILTLDKSQIRLLLSNTDFPISYYKYKTRYVKKIREALNLTIEEYRPIKEFSIEQTKVIKQLFSFSENYIIKKLGYKKD